MIDGDKWILEPSWWQLLLDLALALVLTRMVGHVVDHRRPAAGAVLHRPPPVHRGGGASAVRGAAGIRQLHAAAMARAGGVDE